jgi:DNA topoisomerase-1
MQFAQALNTRFPQSIARKADRPLYVQRRLTPECAEAFITWAKSQGFTKVLAPEELHVTVVYSKDPVDWESLAEDDTELLANDGQRKVEPLGDGGAVVLKFKSDRLQARWNAWRKAGASWDYENYQPHVTITYKNPLEDLKAVQPFTGPLEFQGEEFEPINDTYAETVVEKFEFEFAIALKNNPYHDEQGLFSSKDQDADGSPDVKAPSEKIAENKFMFGECRSFAYALQKELGGELAALYRKGKLMHVFVEKDGKRLDVTGETGKAKMNLGLFGSVMVEQTEIRPIDRKDAGEYKVTEKSLAIAKAYIQANKKKFGLIQKLDFAQVLKANPWRDAKGKLSTKENDADGLPNTPGKQSIAYVKGLGWAIDGKGLSGPLSDRVKALRIPPAWTGVELDHDPKSELQATGYDGKGRKQYLYSAEHSVAAAAAKFERLRKFNTAMPKVRKALGDRLLTNPDDHSAALRLIDRTGIRIGSDEETGGAAKAYGATTLLGKHVKLSGGAITLEFPGKSGQKNNRYFYDKELADYIRQKQANPEDRLFRTSDSKVRDLMKDLAGKDFTPKDFRTWHGTAQALRALKDMPIPTNEKEAKAVKLAVAKKVAEFLNNTPAVALESYINPAVFDRHAQGVKKFEVPDEDQELMDEFIRSVHFDQEVKMAPEPEND